MEKKRYDLIFAIMAVQEAVFFSRIAKRLIDDNGLSVGFILFHEAGEDILKKEGIGFFNIHKISQKHEVELKADLVRQMEDHYNLNNIRDMCRHEMLTANRSNETALVKKAVKYLRTFDQIFKENEVKCVVQELGGFVAPQSLYYSARKNKVDHIFIEPAMFPGRIIFTLNDIFAEMPCDREREKITNDELKDLYSYLENYLKNKTVVIPFKDRMFFQDVGLGKLFNRVNFKKLLRKLYHKYIVRKKEEYDAIGWYAWSNFIRLLRRKFLTFYYRMPDWSEKYVYFPFHVPLDVQLTVRCPQYLNQESLVEYIADCVPFGYKLYVKEHPASIGAHTINGIKGILKKNNVKLIHPRVNSFELIKNAACVITINSKVGAEAIMQEKPVIVVGRAFYSGKGVTFDTNNPGDLVKMIKTAVNGKTDKLRTAQFLKDVYKWSYAGDLYQNNNENVDKFYHSLSRFLKTRVGVCSGDEV